MIWKKTVQIIFLIVLRMKVEIYSFVFCLFFATPSLFDLNPPEFRFDIENSVLITKNSIKVKRVLIRLYEFAS